MTIDLAFDAREMPANIDAEQALLGALLMNNDCVDQLDDLEPHHFAYDLHADIYRAAVDEIGQGREANPLILKSRLASDPRFEDVGGPQTYLVKLLEASGSPSQAGHYARVVVACWQRRHMIALASELRAGAHDSGAAPADTIAATQASLETLDAGVSASAFVSLGDAIDKALGDVERAMHGDIVWRTTGIPGLDAALGGGLRDGNLILLAARPAMGKTALSLSIALSAARIAADSPGDDAGGGVLFFSMEQTDRELGIRATAGETGIDNIRLLRGRIDAGEYDIARSAGTRLGRLPVYFDDRGGLTARQVRSRARAAIRRHDIKLIIVDHIGKMRAENERAQKVHQVEEIVAGLKDLAKETNLPVLALSQLNRGIENRDDKRPQLSDLRDSGAIEQEADVVLMLYREAYYAEKAEPAPGSDNWPEWKADYEEIKADADLFIRKNRHGREGAVRLTFDGARMTFHERQTGQQQTGLEL